MIAIDEVLGTLQTTKMGAMVDADFRQTIKGVSSPTYFEMVAYLNKPTQPALNLSAYRFIKKMSTIVSK